MGFFIIVTIFAVISLVLSCFYFSSLIDNLERDNDKIRDELSAIKELLNKQIISPTITNETRISKSVNYQNNLADIKKESIYKNDSSQLNQSSLSGINYDLPPLPPDSQATSSSEVEEIINDNFEQNFGARLTVWIGGIALALAGIFLIKYSIDNGLLSEKMRVILGVIFGSTLFLLGDFVKAKNLANANKIAQTLIGAAIVDLYSSTYAAVNFYHLISPALGFIAMAIITGLAIFKSLNYGSAIAVFGLVGGLLTPALISTQNPSALPFFAYLYLIIFGLFTVIHKRNWWVLAIPTIIGVYIWMAVWLLFNFNQADSTWLNIFLIGVCATVAYNVSSSEQDDSQLSAINYITIGGALLFSTIIIRQSNFGIIEWELFGLLALGTIILAWVKQEIYGIAPIISAITTAIILLSWQNSDLYLFFIIVLCFFVLYIVSALSLMWKAPNPKLWGILAGGVAVIYYLILYQKFHSDFSHHLTLSFGTDLGNSPLWSISAFILALCSLIIIRNINVRFTDNEINRQYLFAIFSISCVTFLSIAFSVELEKKLLAIVIAAQILAISWVNNRVDIKILRNIASGLLAVFFIIIFWQVIITFDLLLSSIFAGQPGSYNSNEITKLALFYLGLPSLMFFGAAFFFSKEKIDNLVKYLEIAAIGLILTASYYFVRNLFHYDQDIIHIKADFAERGVITNIFFIYGVLLLLVNKKFYSRTLFYGGITVLIAACLRVFYFDLLIYNPLWSHQILGDMILFNALILPLGLPILWLSLANLELTSLEENHYLKASRISMLIFLFFFLSLNIRHIYHGSDLILGITTNAETYSYSVLWIVLGISLLIIGTKKENYSLRIAALILIIITIFKVFFYDASELTGLYRVFSFLGLGVSLIGLSWFYARFISNTNSLKAE